MIKRNGQIYVPINLEDIERKITSTRKSLVPAQSANLLLEKEVMKEVVGEVIISSNAQLKVTLANATKEELHVVLTVTDFPNWIMGILKAIRKCYGMISQEELAHQDIGSCESKRLLEKMVELNDHITRNENNLKNPIEFVVTPGEKRIKEFRCFYSIYKGGQLLKDNLNRLPTPPIELNVQQNKSCLSLQLEWEYEHLGYPYDFLIEYRSKANPNVPWKKQKMTNPSSFKTKTSVDFEPGSAMEIRIAADSYIGRSEFSVFHTERLPYSDKKVNQRTKTNTRNIGKRHSFKGQVIIAAKTKSSSQLTSEADQTTSPLQPPTYLEAESVTHKSIELLWSPTTCDDGALSFSYQVRYWQNGESPAHSLKVGPSNIGCRLENLEPGVVYFVNIVAVSDDGKDTSVPSKTLQLTTLETKDDEVRFAEEMVKRCEKMKGENGLDIYAVPLTESAPGRTGKAKHFVFGKVGEEMQHKTITIIGVNDVDVKSRLINGLINYVFNVDWLDNFRFQLIGNKEAEADDVPVTMYHIYHTEGFRVPYSLTIIDTAEPIAMDEKTFELIFFQDGKEIYDIDMVVFVTNPSIPPQSQFYLFDSIMSVYSDKIGIKGCESRWKTDDEKSIALKCVVKNGKNYVSHKFDSLVVFRWNRKTNQISKNPCGPSRSRRHQFRTSYREYKLNRFMWSMAMKNFECLFSSFRKKGFTLFEANLNDFSAV